MTDAAMTETQGPLAGIRVVEFDAIGPAPLAAMILADLGADVVRISRAGGGFWENTGGAILNRNRPHLNLDLKSPNDREKALELIGHADALIEGLRPGVMERLGLGPEVALQRNPRLAYVRMTGWGQTGPLAQRAGHDLNYIALTGALHAIGSPDRPPPVPLNLLGDYSGGMFAVTGLLSAVISARSTGRGQVVDVAMTDGVAVLSSLFHALSAGGLWSSARGANLLDGGAPFYRCYTCSDGGFVAVGALLEAAFAAHPRDHWATVFQDTDACVTPALSFAEAAEHPHNVARETLARVEGLTQPAPAPRLSATSGRIAPERRGEAKLDDIRRRWMV